MRQNRLFIDREHTSRLIEQRFGSVDALVADWAQERPDEARERAAVYKWLSEGVPTKEDSLFGFCAMLDVDPISIIDYRKIGFFSKFYLLRKAIQSGLFSTGPIPALLKMYGPSADWPSDWLAHKYFKRPWVRAEFQNAEVCQEGHYALLKVSFEDDWLRSIRCVHISYRRTRPKEEMWRPYGWVIQGYGEVNLYAESGDHQVQVAEDPNLIQFRTYFGGRSVEFRIASLHAFQFEIQYPVSSTTQVGFEW